jgi:cell division protease FtsH
MSLLKKLVALARRHARALTLSLSAAAVLAVMAVSFNLLSSSAREDSNTRKSAAALDFEKTPEAWLAHPQEASAFQKSLRENELQAVGVVSSGNGRNGLVMYTLKNGDKFSAAIPGCTALSCAGTVLEQLSTKSVDAGFVLARVDVDARQRSQKVLDAIEAMAGPALLIGILVGGVLLLAHFQGGLGGGAKAARLAQKPKERFDDVIGAVEAKAALQRVAAFMRDPAHYVKLGARAPRGVLLEGPAGVGKTLLAKALAGECNATFIAVDGSYFTSMFYGAGVNKVRELFALARKSAPCVLFIDEVDGIGRRSQGGDMRGGENEMNRIINRVLVEMDGFAPMDGVVVVAATNHAANIDEAMRRPGRFDNLVRLTLPTLPERQRLFDLYMGQVKTGQPADTLALARMTSGMSPADIANTVNKAASSAAEAHAEHVAHEHVLRAIETYQLGGEVSPLKGLLRQDTRERIAYHEAGHALIAHLLNVGIVERVTIEPRGQALGVTYVTRDSEDPLYSQDELTGRLAMMLGGREAELMKFGNVSSGASDDLKRASELAINMVGNLGFSEAFGLLSVAGVPKDLLGPDVQGALLKEARVALDTAQRAGQDLFTRYRGRLEALAQQLLADEVISGQPLKDLLDGKMTATVASAPAEAVALAA